MNKKAILFDLDGTVIDSKLGIFNALKYTFGRLNIEIPADEFLNQFIGPSIGASFIRLYGYSVEQANEAVSIYREYYATKGLYEYTLYDGIKDLIEDLYDAGFKVGLATKKPEPFAKRILEHADLSDKFHMICGSDPKETHDSKAHIVKRCAMELTHDNIADAIMVGDTKYDIIGSNEAGVESIGVVYGYGTREEFVEYNATHITDTMIDLHKLLLGE